MMTDTDASSGETTEPARTTKTRCGVSYTTPGSGPGTLTCTRKTGDYDQHQGVHYDKNKGFWFDHIDTRGWEWHVSAAELR
jgi:hypothetical protein